MKKFLVLFLLSGATQAMEQFKGDETIKPEKQEEEEVFIHPLTGRISVVTKEKDEGTQERDKDNQNLIAALDKSWNYLYGLPADERELFFGLIDQVLDDKRFMQFNLSSLNDVKNLIKAQEDNRKRCWCNMIKVSRMSRLLIECFGVTTKPRPFSVDLQEYLKDQTSGNYDPDEQIDDWLQELLRLSKK